MIFAVIPWSEKELNNELFNADSLSSRDGLNEPYVELKKYMEACGHSINTIDIYQDLSAVDYILFFDYFYEWVDKIVHMGLDSRMVYCNAEPPTVNSLNTKTGYEKIKKYFPYILTWNRDLVDNKRIFYRTIPYSFKLKDNKIALSEKKLLTSISANKHSNYENELYSERERLITYFENELPEQFDMYGVGWDKKKHPSYLGSPKNKAEVYAHYKFALALENTKGVKGYVTEKIFDCLTSGIVPIYQGADDIYEYVSADCFIDYSNFASMDELKSFLLEMSDEAYTKYIDAAKEAIDSSELKERFSGIQYAKNILFMADNANMMDFRVKLFDRIILRIKIKSREMIKQAKKVLKKIIK